MKKVGELFQVAASSLFETMISRGGTAGFRIPEYQRSYNWDSRKIARLLEDAANGLHHLADTQESFTFLGTLILIEENRKEPDFDGVSLAIVDGQQRLTTIILTLCALIEAINAQLPALENLPQNQKQWLHKEANIKYTNCIGVSLVNFKEKDQ